MVWPATPPAQDLDLRGRKVAGMTDSHGSTETPDGAPVRTVAATASGQHENAPGSNSFAVVGELAGGGALVANDMHLSLQVPGIWFRARFVYPDPQRPGELVDVTGASLPGVPVMVVGSNRHVAWGFTNSYVDTSDWVRVIRDPHDASRYRTPTGWQPIAQHAEAIRVKGGSDVVLDVQDTQWGPIIASDADGTPLALAWIAQEPGAVNLGLQDLESAHDVPAAIAVAHRAGIPPQNFVVGDRAGHIAWTIAGKLARRVGDYDPSLPADWSTGAGWDGWLDAAQVPVIDDPGSGHLWTANQRIVDGEALALLGDGGYVLGARAGQIRDALATHEHFTPADMLAIQLDDRALFLDHWRDLFAQTLQHMPDSPSRQQMQTLIAGERAVMQERGFRAATDSVTYRLVRGWRNTVIDHVLDGFTAVVREQFPDFAMPYLSQGESAVWQLLRERPPHLLPPDYASWDEMLARSVTEVGKQLDAQPEGLAKRTWGERNTARIRHPLSRALPDFVAHWLDMPPDELAGDNNMPRVAAPDFGASERFAVTPGDEEHGYFELAGGQSGHPLSPFHGAGHADWVAGKPTPFLPGITVHRLELRP